jgi:glutaredoxin-like YruB-family protein
MEGGNLMTLKNTFIALVCILLLIIGYNVSMADIYKWVDQDGTVYFQDTPPHGISKSTKVQKIKQRPNESNDYEPQEIRPPQNSGYKQTANAHPKVEIYITSWCSYCKQAKEYLSSRGIPFTEYDIEKDKDAMRRKHDLSPKGGVPVAVINGKVIRGFASDAYDDALAGRP